MSKLIVNLNNKFEDIDKVLTKNIDGVIFSIKDLSVNSNYYIDIKTLENLLFKFKDKMVIISLNKIMHNSDLSNLEEVLIKLAKLKVDKVLFYDLSVFSIVKRLNLDLDLIIAQDHLNASYASNNFYYNEDIKNSYLTNDITIEEALEIKHKTKMNIFYTVYGYLPIFYSRRYLLSSYFEYIKQAKKDNFYYLSLDNKKYYPIVEEDYGTTIYTHDKINLLGQLNRLEDIDYLVINSIYTEDIDIVIDKFLLKEKVEDAYLGFANEKTIYKVVK